MNTVHCYHSPSSSFLLVLIYIMTFLKAPHSSLSRPRKNGTATGVDAICAFYHDPAHPGIDIKELYTELRNLTQGITQLGNYSLDKDSLYVNGECSL